MASNANGTTAPAAMSPLNLFSIVSRTSSGFFQPGGSVAPKASFAAQRHTSSNAGTQNFGCAYHDSFARATLSWADHHWNAPYAPVPSNGEIARPVTVEMADAI